VPQKPLNWQMFTDIAFVKILVVTVAVVPAFLMSPPTHNSHVPNFFKSCQLTVPEFWAMPVTEPLTMLMNANKVFPLMGAVPTTARLGAETIVAVA